MTARVVITPITQPPEVRGIWPQIRVINQNFRGLADDLNRAITGGTLLSTAQKTLIGDVTGTIGDDGATTVEKIRGVTIPAPAAGDDGKVVYYNHSGPAFAYADKLTDVLTTRGDIVTRGASAEQRLAVGAANTLLKSDGTDPGWGTVTALLDAVFSSAQGAILYRDAAAWAALAPGTSGHYLQTAGAGANPAWAAVAGASNALLDASNHTDTAAGAVVRGDIITGQGGTPKWTRLALGASGKYLYSDGTDAVWGDPPAGTAHNLLSATHSDTTAASVVAGDIIYGDATPKWVRLPKGSNGDVLTLASGLPSWAAPGAAGSSALLSATHTDTTAASVVRGDIITGQGSSPTWSRLALGSRGGLLMSKVNEPSYAPYTSWDTIPSMHVMSHALFRLGNVKTIETAGTASGTHADPAEYPIHAGAFTNSTTTAVGYFVSTSCQARYYSYFRCYAKVVDNADGVTWIGFASAALTSTITGVADMAIFRCANGTDTNWMACTKDATTLGTTDTGVALDGNWHCFEVYTPDGGTTWKFKIDGVEVASRTTNVPTTNVNLRANCIMPAISSSAREIRIGGLYTAIGYGSTTQVNFLDY